MAARGRRPPFQSKFRQPQQSAGGGGIQAILKQSRKSGQLNLSNKSLSEVPGEVWRINIDVPDEARQISLDNAEDRWWDQVELTKIILASNILTTISEDIHQLPALTVLDVHDNRLTSLPDALGSLHNLQKLHLGHNQLTSLPDCIGNLESLQYLHVEYNELTELPDRLGQLKVLEELDISHNKLTRLPLCIGYLSGVFRFNFSNNLVQVIPHEVGCMQSLRTLDGTHNQIHTLPDEMGSLLHLEQLYLRHNRLTYLPLLQGCSALKELHLGNNQIAGLSPEHLETLTSVSVLDLRDNRLAKLPEEITLLAELERLDITNNGVSQLPYVLGNMTKLKSLVLDGNPLKSIRRDIVMRGTNELKKYLRSRIEEAAAPAEPAKGVRQVGGSSGIVGGVDDGQVDKHSVGASKALDYSGKKASSVPEDVWELAVSSEVKVINLSKNALQAWPDKLQELGGSLSELNLGFNRIPAVPAAASALTALVFIDLRNNQLSGLPSEMSALTKLRELTLSCNRLQELPAVVYELAALEVLLLNDNKIATLEPERVRTGLPRLATLDLQNNNISSVPPELGRCDQLRSLQLEGNAFRVPRPAILAKGTLALLDYLRGRIPT